jgi:hypothetical protein
MGTDRGRGSALNAKGVPSVPSVPTRNEALLRPRQTACPHDVLERAAFLEFCEGLTRKEADALALAEFNCTSWEDLPPTRGDVAGWTAYQQRPLDG